MNASATHLLRYSYGIFSYPSTIYWSKLFSVLELRFLKRREKGKKKEKERKGNTPTALANRTKRSQPFERPGTDQLDDPAASNKCLFARKLKRPIGAALDSYPPTPWPSSYQLFYPGLSRYTEGELLETEKKRQWEVKKKNSDKQAKDVVTQPHAVHKDKQIRIILPAMS